VADETGQQPAVPRPPLTEDRLRQLLDSGLTVAEAAAELGFNAQYVLRRAKGWGLEIPEETRRRRELEAFRDELADKYLTGRTVPSLAAEYGRSTSFINANLNSGFVHTGLPGRRGRATPDRVRAALAEGLTVAEIAEQLRCPEGIVRRAIAHLR
jgi:AraC-like DNA-binding protein